MKARAAVATGEPAVAPKGVGSSTFATAEQGALGDLARVVQSSAYPRLANPQVSLTFESQKQVSQNVIDVTFEQLDRYDYEYEGGRTPTEGEPTFIAEKYPRVVQFELVNGSWKVSKTHAQTAARPELEPPENFTSTTFNAPDMGGAPVNAQTEDAASNVTPQPQSNAAAATTRSRAKFRDYALKHAYNYNPSYRDFGGILSGGDCTISFHRPSVTAGSPTGVMASRRRRTVFGGTTTTVRIVGPTHGQSRTTFTGSAEIAGGLPLSRRSTTCYGVT